MSGLRSHLWLFCLLGAGCQVLVTFDPFDADGGGEGVDDGEAGDSGEDGGEGLEDAAGGEGDSDVPSCGNGVVDPGEECDGELPRACTTRCGSAGETRCVGCLWATECAVPPEVCNGLDDDCDTAVDDGFPCSPGSRVPCRTWCGSLGEGSCSPACRVPDEGFCEVIAEVCDGEDNDCDGVPDDGFACAAGSRLPCVTSCGTAGYRLCTGACAVPPAGTPCILPEERCDGTDEDCDGECDEGFGCCARAAVSCTTACGSVGTGNCADDCTLPAGDDCVPPVEGCNGSDDDCDGECDEGFACCAGEVLPCTLACGVPGSAPCRDDCTVPGVADCLPPEFDRCDGIDADCDTLVDEDGYDPPDDPTRVTAAPGRSEAPAVVFTGSGFAAAWRDDRDGGGGEIYLARFDSRGGLVGEARRITDAAGFSGHPSLAWTGAGFGLAWRDDRSGNGEIRFRRLEADGGPLGEEIALSATPGLSTLPALVWSGAVFGVAWRDQAAGLDEIRFTRVDADGREDAMGDRAVASAVGIAVGSGPSLAATASGWAVAWDDTRGGTPEVWLLALGGAGAPAGAPVPLTDGPAASVQPSLVWTGSGYAAAWRDFRDGNYEIYFGRWDEAVRPQGDPVRVSRDPDGAGALSTGPRLVRTVSDFALAWEDHAGGAAGVRFQRLDRTGLPVGRQVGVAGAAGAAGGPAAAGTAGRFGVAWSDRRDGDGEIYFAALGCD